MMVLFETICGGALSPVEAIVGTPRGKAEGDLSRQANEKDGGFALLWAARLGYEAVVRVLLEAGADAKQVSSAECRGGESGGGFGVYSINSYSMNSHSINSYYINSYYINSYCIFVVLHVS